MAFLRRAPGIMFYGAVWIWAASMAARPGNDPVIGGPPVRARVVQVDHPGATVDYLAQPSIVQDMVRRGMLQWTGKTDLKGAWLTVVSREDVVGLKVYS